MKGNKAARLQQDFEMRCNFSEILAQIGQQNFESQKVG